MKATTTKDDQAVDPLTIAGRIAAAKARAGQFIENGREEMGTVLGLTANHKPYWFVASELGDGRAESMRRDLLARGYEKAPQATVSGIGGAEVWEVHEEVAAMLDAARKNRDQKAQGQAHRAIQGN